MRHPAHTSGVAPKGAVAEWQCRGLQIPASRFDSGLRLHLGSGARNLVISSTVSALKPLLYYASPETSDCSEVHCAGTFPS